MLKKTNLAQLKGLAASSTSDDIVNRNQIANAYISELYKADNKSLRNMLENYLSKILDKDKKILDTHKNLNQIIEDDYVNGNKQTRESTARALELAQKLAEKDLNNAAQAAELYQHQEQLNKSAISSGYLVDKNGKLTYDPTVLESGITQSQHNSAVLAGHGHGLATAGVVMGGAAIAGSAAGAIATALGATAAVSSAIPVIGWIVGAIAAVGAGIAGIAVGIASAQALEAKHQQENIKTWEQMSLEEKIAAVEAHKDSKELKDALNSNDKETADNAAKQLQASEEFLQELKDYRAYLQTLINQQNQLTIEASLIATKVGTGSGDYLLDMNIEQLKQLGITGIYEALAKQVEADGGLLNMAVFTDDGKLSEEFINAVTKQLKTDAEISSVLTGEKMTLSEAVYKFIPNNEITTDRFNLSILENFANALGVSVAQLSDYTDKFGTLTLSELLMGTLELNEEMKTYDSLIDSITSGSSSVSSWMSTIIKQFPELTAYMSDVPSLIEQIIKKTQSLNERSLQAQWEELANSTEFFMEKGGFRDELLASVGDYKGAIEELFTKEGITSMAGIRQWLAGQTSTEDKDTGIITFSDPKAQALYEAFVQAGSQYSLTSDEYRNSLQKVIDYNTKLLTQQIDNLTQQKEALQDINKQREYENKLVEARLKLENAQKEKKRVYRAGIGWVYEADQEAIRTAQEELETVEKEKDISALTTQIDALTAQKDDWSNIWEKKNFELLETFVEKFNKEYGLDGSGHTLIDAVTNNTDGIKKTLNEISDTLLNKDQTEKNKAVENVTKKWNEYQESLNNGSSVTTQNSKLQEFINAWNKAADKGYVDESTLINDSGAAAEVIKNPGKYKKQATYGWNLSGYQLESSLEHIYQSDANSIWTDMQNKKEKKSLANAMIWYKDQNGEIQQYSLTDGRLPANLQISKDDTDLLSYASRVNSAGYGEVVIGGLYGDNEFAYIKDGVVYRMTESNGSNSKLAPTTTDLSTLSVDQKRLILDNMESFAPDFYKKYEEGLYWAVNSSNIQKYLDYINGYFEEYLKLLDDGSTDNWRQELSEHASGTLDLINERGTEAIITPRGTITALPSHSGIIPADITKNLWALGEVAPEILRMTRFVDTPDFNSSGLLGGVDESLNVNNLVMNVNADKTFDAEKFVNSLRTYAALTKNLK